MKTAQELYDGLKAGTITIEKFHELMKSEGRKIDARSADISWGWGQVLDPYGVYAPLLEEERCIGRLYFARALGSDIWVEFGDLPDETSDALWDRLGSRKSPETVPFNNRVERVADAIVKAYASLSVDEPSEACMLEAIQAAVRLFKEADETTS
jgi:hypothetical protein